MDQVRNLEAVPPLTLLKGQRHGGSNLKVNYYNIRKKMDKIELCPICGNNHMGSCSSELTYFHWTPKEGERVPGMVEVVGEWHRWQHHEQMSKESDDKGVVYFELGVSIPVGKYEYKFVVDGEWTCSDESPTVQNPYGSYNNVVEVCLR